MMSSRFVVSRSISADISAWDWADQLQTLKDELMEHKFGRGVFGSNCFSEVWNKTLRIKFQLKVLRMPWELHWLQCLRGTSISSFGWNLHGGLGDHIDPRRLGGWVGRAFVGKPRSPEMPYEASHMRHQRQQASSPGTLIAFITSSTHWARTRSFTMRTQDLDSRSA